MMMHEDWGMTQNYVVEDAWRSIDLSSISGRDERWLGEVCGREADFSTALLTIRL
jgi:hypothetical protein